VRDKVFRSTLDVAGRTVDFLARSHVLDGERALRFRVVRRQALLLRESFSGRPVMRSNESCRLRSVREGSHFLPQAPVLSPGVLFDAERTGLRVIRG
jgi:hypothetical protein